MITNQNIRVYLDMFASNAVDLYNYPDNKTLRPHPIVREEFHAFIDKVLAINHPLFTCLTDNKHLELDMVKIYAKLSNRSKVQILSGIDKRNFNKLYAEPKKVLSLEEIENILRKGVDMLDQIKGTTINQKQAKELYLHTKMGYRISEYRLNEYTSHVTMQLSDSGKYFLRNWSNIDSGEIFFMVKGKLGKQLNMCE